MRSVPGSIAQFGTDPRTNGQGFPNSQCGRDETDFAGAVKRAVLDYCNGIGTGAPDGPQNVVTGWNKREFDWQFGIGIQHEVVPRVSVEVTYNRRWYGNFQLNDNISLGCNLDQACLQNNLSFVNPHYDFYSISAPVDSNLPEAVATHRWPHEPRSGVQRPADVDGDDDLDQPEPLLARHRHQRQLPHARRAPPPGRYEHRPSGDR